MSMRIKPPKIIITLKKNSLDVGTTAYELGIHRSTVYRWIKRARTGWGISSRNLRRKSTRPKTIHFALNARERAEAIVMREKKGYTAEKIIKKLNLSIHPSNLHRLLKAQGLVRKYGYHIRPYFQQTLHMHLANTKTIGYLQMDVKYITPQLSGLPYTCFEYAVIDIFSRYKEAVILNQLDQDGSISAILTIIPKLPFRVVFTQTDNGLEFQERFHKVLTDMGIKHHYVHKDTPNENAVIERSFRTDEDEFFSRLDKAPQNYDELREWFSLYLHEYNHERPHLGINLRTPYEVVANVLLD